MKKHGRIVLLLFLFFCSLFIISGCGPATGNGQSEDSLKELEEPALPVEQVEQVEQVELKEQEEITDPDYPASEGLSLGERMRNDKMLQVLDMNKQEVMAELGEPDFEDWWAGPYIYYEDASPLIQADGTGVTNQNYLWIWIDDDEKVVNTHLSYFAGVETGMSFTKAMDLLDQELQVFDDLTWGEFGQYYMTYHEQDYMVSFFSYDSADGPIGEILVEKENS